jgi:hypothetical protein
VKLELTTTPLIVSHLFSQVQIGTEFEEGREDTGNFYFGRGMLLHSIMIKEKWRNKFICFGEISRLQIVPNIYHSENGTSYKVSAVPSTVIVIPRDRNSMKHVIRNHANWSKYYACILVDHKAFPDHLLIQCTPGYKNHLQDMKGLRKIIPDADDATSIIEHLLSNGDFNCLVMYPLQKYNPSLCDLPKTHWVVQAMSQNEKVFGLNVGGFGYLKYNECDNGSLTKRLKPSTSEDTSIQEVSTFSNEDDDYDDEEEEGSDEEEGGSDEEEEDSDEEEEGSDEEEEGSDEESKTEEESDEENIIHDEEDEEEDKQNCIGKVSKVKRMKVRVMIVSPVLLVTVCKFS